MLLYLFLCLPLCCVFGPAQTLANQPKLVYAWANVTFDWPNDTMRDEYVTSGQFIQENNQITGIKVYNGNVYVSVPRWLPGVPSTLNIVQENDGSPSLRAYPDWEMQEVGNCDALQYVQGMEIDPNTGYMWIADVARINTNTNHPDNKCPPKLVIYDIEKDRVVRVHIFPTNVVSRVSSFLNDVVLDYVNGKAAYAYIPDTFNGKLVVYNFEKDLSYYFQHPTMDSEIGAKNFNRGNNLLSVNAKLDGIAMSPDFKYVYYCALSAFTLYRVETTVLREASSNLTVEMVGRKVSQTDGMVFGSRHLYFGALMLDGVYSWEYGEPFNQFLVANDTSRMRWVDTFAFDSSGYLWFVANKLDVFFSGKMDFTSNVQNIFVWKLNVKEDGYLFQAGVRTSSSTNDAPVVSTHTIFMFAVLLMYSIVF